MPATPATTPPATSSSAPRVAVDFERLLTRIVTDLGGTAFLHDDAGAYRAGVEDAAEAILASARVLLTEQSVRLEDAETVAA